MQYSSYDRCTDRLKGTINNAHALARRRCDDAVWPEHLFVSLDCGGCANEALRRLGVSLPDLQKTFVAHLRCGMSERSELELDDRSVSVLDHANDFAESLGHSYRGTEHLIWGLVEVSSPVSWFLKTQGLTSEAIREVVLELLGRGID